MVSRAQAPIVLQLLHACLGSPDRVVLQANGGLAKVSWRLKPVIVSDCVYKRAIRPTSRSTGRDSVCSVFVIVNSVQGWLHVHAHA